MVIGGGSSSSGWGRRTASGSCPDGTPRPDGAPARGERLISTTTNDVRPRRPHRYTRPMTDVARVEVAESRARARPRPWARSIRNVVEIVQGRHVRIWLLVVLATALIGTIGYVVLFRWSLSDSVFMTVITMTT